MVSGFSARAWGAAIVLSLAAMACERPAPDIAREKTRSLASERYAVGAASFGRYCALCHGVDATGYAADHAPSLVSATYLESASDEMIARGIREGRPGTAMAPYAKARGGPIDDDEIEALITFLRERHPSRVRLPSTPIAGDIVRGEALFAETCQRCHGSRLVRGDAVHLANPALLSAASDAFLRYAIVHGHPGTPMPAFRDALSDQQVDDLVAFVRSWATPPEPQRKALPEPPPLGPVVINPRGPHPDFTLRDDRFVPIADAKAALDAGKRMVIIDARATSDWMVLRIPGSISIPYFLFDRLDQLPKDGTWITAYCACPHHASGAVIDELRKRGFKHTAVLDEGILEWKKRNYPTESDPLPPPEPGQTQPALIPMPTSRLPMLVPAARPVLTIPLGRKKP
ncbi:MAG: c-type cytochrome [Minicystis sp.]